MIIMGVKNCVLFGKLGLELRIYYWN